MLTAAKIVFIIFTVLFFLSSMGTKDERRTVILMAGAIANALLLLGSIAIGGHV